MSSYLTTLLTTTTSRYASLRSLIPSHSEQDGDTEDDTHLCRVLRAYYIEKGRPFPAWLPPDPKAPQPVIQPVYSSNIPVGAGYGGLTSGGGSKLGSLWDSQPANQQTNAPQSLRPSRGVASSALRGGRQDPYSRQQQSQEPTIQARPLPSQRAGSYQTVSRSDNQSGSSGSGPATGPTTAQDRLKARLWGTAKSNQSQISAGQQNRSGSTPNIHDRGGNFDNGYGNGSSEGAGGYEDRAMSMGSSRSRGGPGGGDRPFVAATAPWASNEDEFLGGGYGLPSGPSAGRRAGGAAGPRGMR